MSYFGGSLSARGDPGFFGSLFGGVKKLAGGIFRATPVGGAISSFIPPRGIGPGRAIPQIRPKPGFRGAVERTLPGGATGFEINGGPRRRRMNVGNTRALRRAIRRTDGFVRLAKVALKNTGFKIVSKSAGRMTEAQFQKRQHHAK